MKVTRRKPIRYAGADDLDLRYVVLRFTDGTVVDKRRCPSGIQARWHWHRPAGAPVDPETGANAVCVCTHPKQGVS